jgi:hypothetical protein
MEFLRDPRYRLTMRCIVALLTTVTAVASAAAENNHCELSITGDANATVKADVPAATTQGNLSASTDYWLSDAQIRSAASVLLNIGSKLTPAEKQRKLDEAMKKDPRFMLLLVNCLTDEAGVIFSAAGGSKYANVPLKPAAYSIAANRKSKPGDFTVMFHLSTGGKQENYAVKEPGKLTLTQFDRKGIAGTFRFTAEEMFSKPPKRVAVSGAFKYPCLGDACQK